ncbi:TonB-dependent receptor plug domain-containing protein [Teredinibacter franksiae]|uniref:TonB-dependent receptor plug domain-containing protein n=1 Tax=Teredinibacter franksiae TaxID=2761453 RepID=UPI001627F29B|nr:TonB-dependent receptor plug domain-containing protein [Teredinibacter franksiae]
MSIKVEVASRHKEQARLTPSSVTIFLRHQILEMEVRSVEELLNFVPGFQTSRVTFLNQGYRVVARGLVTGQPSYSVLFLMDGQRMNSDMSGGAMFDNRFITTANVDRVEVILGPGSAMYGSSAFSGVVNIITTKDTNEAYVAADDYGSRELYTNGSVHNNH